MSILDGGCLWVGHWAHTVKKVWNTGFSTWELGPKNPYSVAQFPHLFPALCVLGLNDLPHVSCLGQALTHIRSSEEATDAQNLFQVQWKKAAVRQVYGDCSFINSMIWQWTKHMDTWNDFLQGAKRLGHPGCKPSALYSDAFKSQEGDFNARSRDSHK